MSHKVRWLIEDRVVFHKHSTTLIKDDILLMFSKTIDMMSSVDEPVHIVADLSEVKSLTPDFGNISELKKISQSFLEHPNLGESIFYGSSNKIVNFFGNILFQLAKREWKSVDSYEDAVNTLIRLDPALKEEFENLSDKIIW